MCELSLVASRDEGVKPLCFLIDQGMDLVMLVDSRSIGTDLIDLGERRQPFGAFSFHACPVLPQGKLHLVRDMPQTALKKDFDRSFEPIEDCGVSIRHQKKALERFEPLQALPEEAIPAPIVGADVDSGHPNRSPFQVLDQDLQLLASFLDPPNANARAIGLSSGLPLGIQGKRDLFARLLHRPPIVILSITAPKVFINSSATRNVVKDPNRPSFLRISGAIR